MKTELIVIGLAVGALTAEGTVPGRYVKQSEEWFRSTEGRRIAENVVTWQSPEGSWPKNRDTGSEPFEGAKEELRGTFDNGATTSELRFLARAYRATVEEGCKAAFARGLDHILEAQYPTGGWPQRFPPGRGYARHITFNDNSMVRILELLREVGESAEYEFVETERRWQARRAFERGIECIVQAQIVVNGKRTVWCAQHDEVDLSPRPARSYELESLSGAESAGILRLLMSLEEPSAEVRRAIRAGAEWYESAKIMGRRVKRVQGNKMVVADPDAPPLWARFYEIETNRPFFCGRDGVKKYELAEIEAERRNGYAWYGDWGEEVAEEYAEWKERWGEE